MPTVTVFNRGGNPVEAAGRAWPPRRPTIADLDDRQMQTVRAHPRLKVIDDTPPGPPDPPGDDPEDLEVEGGQEEPDG